MDEVKDAAEAAGDHPVVRTGARVGYAVNGVVHLLIGWLGVQLALGQGGEDADQSGALRSLREIRPGHFVFATDKEMEGYEKKLAEIENAKNQ